jgi:hypothetical protein
VSQGTFVELGPVGADWDDRRRDGCSWAGEEFANLVLDCWGGGEGGRLWSVSSLTWTARAICWAAYIGPVGVSAAGMKRATRSSHSPEAWASSARLIHADPGVDSHVVVERALVAGRLLPLAALDALETCRSVESTNTAKRSQRETTADDLRTSAGEGQELAVCPGRPVHLSELAQG